MDVLWVQRFLVESAKRFKKVRSLADVKRDPRVEEVYKEDDTYWFVHLKPGYVWRGYDSVGKSFEKISVMLDFVNHDIAQGKPR